MTNVKHFIQDNVNQIFDYVINTKFQLGKFDLFHCKLCEFFCLHFKGGFQFSLLKTGIAKVKVIVDKKEYNFDINILDISQLKAF